MIRVRFAAFAVAAFVVSSFGSFAMADCGGSSNCGGGRTGLLARLHAKKESCGAAKGCNGGGLLAKLHAKKAARCSGAAASCSAPAPACDPAPTCDPAPAPTADCGCGETAVVSQAAAPCSNCGTAVDSGSITTASAVPPAPAAAAPAAAAPAAPAVPAAPAAPAAPVSPSDVPKA